MKVAVLAAVTGLIMVPAAQAEQQQRHIGPQPTTCNNDGHCTTLNTTRPTPDFRKSRRQARATSGRAVDHQGSPPLDANGNTVEIVSGKTGARARVGVAQAARFQAYIDDLENNYGARVVFMAGIRPAAVRSTANIRAERPWMCANFDVARLTRVAICRVARCWARSPLHTACLRADAGVIQTMATHRSG